MNTQKKIKILRIIARLNVGGPAVHTILLTQGLNNAEFSTLLVTGRVEDSEKDMLDYAEEKNIEVFVIPELGRKISLFKDLISLIKIFMLIKREKPDIIHTHTAKAGALGRIAGIFYNATRKDKAKLIHTFHGTVLQGYFGKLKTNFFIWIERLLGFFSDQIIVVSESVKKELLDLEIGSPEKICVIPLGLDIDKLLSIPYAKVNRRVNFGMVARLVPVKNHKMLLSACKEFIRTNGTASGSYRFLIVGDGELRQELEQAADELGINSNIEFCGWNLETFDIYNQLDVVVLTSLNEGTPLSLIEAMSAARPIIATDVGGVKDLFIKNRDYKVKNSNRLKIYDNGILCQSRDANGLAEAFYILLRDEKLRQEMGNCGREFVRNRFSKERLIKDIQILYNNCLRRGERCRH